MNDLFQLAVVAYLGWRLILQKGAYADCIPASLKTKHFVACVFIGYFCLDLTVMLGRLVKHLGKLELAYSEAFKVFDPNLSIFIDFLGGLVGAICLVLCHGAASRNRRSLYLFRGLIPILALYYFFAEFRAAYEKGYSILTIGIATAIGIGIPTALLLRFYYKRENFWQLAGDKIEDVTPAV